MIRVHRVTITWIRISTALLLLFGASAAQATQNVRFHGRVIAARTNDPISKAVVSIRDRSIQTNTAENGEFEFADVESGPLELYVTTTGYGAANIRTRIARRIFTLPLKACQGPKVKKKEAAAG